MDNEELNTIIFCAFRYAIGRRTYIVSTISKLIIKHWISLNRRNRIQIQIEIREAIDNNRAGDNCDVECWKKVLDLT